MGAYLGIPWPTKTGKERGWISKGSLTADRGQSKCTWQTQYIYFLGLLSFENHFKKQIAHLHLSIPITITTQKPSHWVWPSFTFYPSVHVTDNQNLDCQNSHWPTSSFSLNVSNFIKTQIWVKNLAFAKLVIRVGNVLYSCFSHCLTRSLLYIKNSINGCWANWSCWFSSGTLEENDSLSKASSPLC